MIQFDIVISNEESIREAISNFKSIFGAHFEIQAIEIRDGVEFATIEMTKDKRLGSIFDLGYYYARRFPPKPIKSGFKD